MTSLSRGYVVVYYSSSGGGRDVKNTFVVVVVVTTLSCDNILHVTVSGTNFEEHTINNKGVRNYNNNHKQITQKYRNSLLNNHMCRWHFFFFLYR